MANSTIDIPFYAACGGQPLTGASGEMAFESLVTLDGTDKSASAPSISEIGGGWYSFAVAYGTAPFDAGDLVGVIDADKDGTNGLSDAERYIPFEVRLDFYALARLVNTVKQNKLTGDMLVKDGAGDTIIKLSIDDGEDEVTRQPAIA